MRVLLTGFASFPGVPVNATMALVPQLAAAAKRRFPGAKLIADVLPTEWLAAPRQMEVLLLETQPDLILHFGVSARARGFEVEQRGQNRCLLAADAGGALPVSTAVRAGGPEMLRASLPVNYIVARLRRIGIPAFASRDAGGYLCNATLYHSLAAARDRPGRRVGFIHVPANLARPAAGLRRSAACPLTWAQALEGGLEILATCLNRFCGASARPVLAPRPVPPLGP
ncbi:MAG TPA: pyroglutamyl-peptidase I [Hyphomicrobiaceae bacterium]|jgi:pyroglutamyl-peptidase|nr:pyroglutamyl-peptidase I [Hyphomicrobiaceae bacterium]